MTFPRRAVCTKPLCPLNYELPVFHILCYSIHEESTLPSAGFVVIN